MSSLVIVESPAKAKTINKILGKDFVVKASMGHVRDLPERDLGVDIENGFKPKYVTIKTREKVLRELKESAAKVDAIYLAPDPDREGEAIAWHLMAALRTKNDPRRYLRVTYNEITAPAIRRAFQAPREIDQNKVDAQQARRVLDRIVGYQVSPLLWRRFRGATSAGRVQSVALRLVCEREREILGFKPEEYWLLGAKVRKFVDPRDVFEIRLARINGEKADVKSAEQAHAVRADVEGRPLRVSAIVRRELSRRAPPSFITSTLQQAASSRLGYAPKRTMQLAQRLYEGEDFGEGPVGLITYMRTDSVALSPVAVQAAREFIHRTFGPDFIPETPNFYKSKASAQEAHEAIRPTDVNRTPEALAHRLQPDELKLYRLIWERFVACQMAPAKIAQRTAEIEALPAGGRTTPYLFRATASDLLFPGYMKVTGVEEKKEDRGRTAEDGEDEEVPLPELKEGEDLEPVDWVEARKETQPPPRYTEASLVKALEENGVGRPSTYAATISVIVDRNYVEKDKRALKPTSIGLTVNDFLVKYLPALFDIKFTARMEGLLDEVEEGKVEWHQMLADFHKPFLEWVAAAKGPPADVQAVRGFLEAFGQVKEWAPGAKRGRKLYSDEGFIQSVREQLDGGEKAISERQLDALVKMSARYKNQIPDLPEVASRFGQAEALHGHDMAQQPPSPEMKRKLELLAPVTFGEPRQIGKRVFDDRKFYESLRDQVTGGRGLTVNQAGYLDKLVFKYADQIPDFEAQAKELALDRPVADGDPHAGPLLELMRGIAAWKPPVQRGKMTWDDKGFFDSLDRQFRIKKVLTIRQSAALKKMLRRYAEQVPGYDEKIETMGLLPRKAAKRGA